MKKLFIISLFFPLTLSFSLYSKTLETVYGNLEVEEEVVLELIESPTFQRLKALHQYGIFYYAWGCEKYTRYDHCIGVFSLLRLKGAPLEEQIAGLLHDVSHTAFSHAGDFLFPPHEDKDAYQDTIFDWFLTKTELGSILKKHGFSLKEIDPKSSHFRALEQELPELCADRIDYNLQGALHKGMITKEEFWAIFETLQFDGVRWTLGSVSLAEKLGHFPLHMTLHCWSSPANLLANTWLSASLKKAMELGFLSLDDIHFGTDLPLWNKLLLHPDSTIQANNRYIANPLLRYKLCPKNEAEIHLNIKFRGVDPWIRTENGLERLTHLSPAYANEYEQVKQTAKSGWHLKHLEK